VLRARPRSSRCWADPTGRPRTNSHSTDGPCGEATFQWVLYGRRLRFLWKTLANCRRDLIQLLGIVRLATEGDSTMRTLPGCHQLDPLHEPLERTAASDSEQRAIFHSVPSLEPVELRSCGRLTPP
jgi:hypothetical protein